MKLRRAATIPDPIVINQNYITTIYEKLKEKIEELEKLNKEFKIRQEDQFLKTFMNVI